MPNYSDEQGGGHTVNWGSTFYKLLDKILNGDMLDTLDTMDRHLTQVSPLGLGHLHDIRRWAWQGNGATHPHTMDSRWVLQSWHARKSLKLGVNGHNAAINYLKGGLWWRFTRNKLTGIVFDSTRWAYKWLGNTYDQGTYTCRGVQNALLMIVANLSILFKTHGVSPHKGRVFLHPWGE